MKMQLKIKCEKIQNPNVNKGMIHQYLLVMELKPKLLKITSLTIF